MPTHWEPKRSKCQWHSIKSVATQIGPVIWWVCGIDHKLHPSIWMLQFKRFNVVGRGDRNNRVLEIALFLLWHFESKVLEDGWLFFVDGQRQSWLNRLPSSTEIRSILHFCSVRLFVTSHASDSQSSKPVFSLRICDLLIPRPFANLCKSHPNLLATENIHYTQS